MKYLEDQVLILSRINYGENDRILTALGPKLGKIKVMAKGIRKSTSKLAGNVELLSLAKLNLVQSREGGMVRLTGAKTVEHYPEIVKDADGMMMVYEWLKTVDKISPDGEGQEYFELLHTSLNALNEQKISAENIHIWLYIQLINASGYTLNWDNLPDLRGAFSAPDLSESPKTDISSLSVPTGTPQSDNIGFESTQNNSGNQEIPHTAGTDLTDGVLDFDFASHQFVPSASGIYSQAMVKLIKFHGEAEMPKQVVCDQALQIASGKLLSEIIKRIV
ncbi:MAG: DNA repair protein RecO [Patescibacteria group bacterium]